MISCEAVYGVHVGLDLMREFGFTESGQGEVAAVWHHLCCVQNPEDTVQVKFVL